MEAVLDARWDSRDRRTQAALKRGSLRICLAAGILAAVALAVFLGSSALGFSGAVDHLARTSLPGVVSVSASQPGELVVYYEGHMNPRLTEIGLRVRGPDGAVLALQPYGFDQRYGVGGRVGTGVASFAAPAAGRYLVSGKAPEPGARLAVGSDLGTGILLTDLAGMGVAFATLALIVAVAAHVLRRSAVGRTGHRQERHGS